jgi:hypothetical protein
MKHSINKQSNGYLTVIKELLLTVTIITHFNFTSAQELNIYHQQSLLIPPMANNLLAANKEKTKFWRAAAEWTATQMIPWASNRYIRKAPFAKISLKSIQHNLNPKNMEWDDNKFFNNQFSHPYQGSLYFNSFRSNGYNFWQSIPAVVLGSYTWETVMETHVPAPNDLINTTLGGIAFGEMSHRLSKIILRKRTPKSLNIIKQPLAFAINPIAIVNNIVDHPNKVEPETGTVESNQISIIIDAGKRMITTGGKYNSDNQKNEIFGRMDLQYGDPSIDFKKPFNNFSVIIEVGNGDTATANRLQIEGCIYGKKIKTTSLEKHVFSISMNYDFFNNSSFVFGVQSFEAKLLSSIRVSKNSELKLKAGVGVIPLAALPNPYMYYGEGRNYDYGMGVSVNMGAAINIVNKIFYIVNLRGGKAITINGDPSTHSFYVVNSSLRLIIYKTLSFSANSNHYCFAGNFKNYPTSKEDHLFKYFTLGYAIHL